LIDQFSWSRKKPFCSLMMPILGFMKCFAQFQKLDLRNWKGACVCLFL